MTVSAAHEAVFVETAGRLHFGVLDLRRSGGRWFGGIGAAAPAPTLLVSARPAETLKVAGEDSDRAAAFATRFLDHYRIRGGADLRIHRALPAHAGLGSGTQLALAVGRVLAEIHGVGVDVVDLARAMGRACRSAIGTWTFAGGGLVVEGGRRSGHDQCGPLIARLPFPQTWRCIVAVPDAVPSLSGSDEAAALARLPPPADREVEHVAHLVLVALMPALVEADLTTFGGTLTAIQNVTGRWFAAVQGGTYAPGPSTELLHLLEEWGATGVGQSSWGPAVYGIVDGADAGVRLAERVRARLGAAGTVYEGPFRPGGARVWRTREVE